MVSVKIVGGIETTDEHGQDDKIHNFDSKIDKENEHIGDLNDIPVST